VDFFPGPPHDLLLHMLRYYDNAVDIGNHQIAWGKHHTVDFHGHVQVDHSVAVLAVVNGCPASPNGKAHVPHLGHVAHCAVDDNAHAAAAAGSRGKQLTP